jgi:hypothetical protein
LGYLGSVVSDRFKASIPFHAVYAKETPVPANRLSQLSPEERVAETKRMIEEGRERLRHPPAPQVVSVDRRINRRSRASKNSDLGSDFRAQHGGVTLETSELTAGGVPIADRRRVRVQCVLERLRLSDRLTHRQFDAAMEFRRIWAPAALRQQVTAAYGVRRGSGNGESDIDARIALYRAMLGAKIARQVPISKSEPDRLLTEFGLAAGAARQRVVLTAEGRAVVSVAGLDEAPDGELAILCRGLDRLADYWKFWERQ